MPVQLDELWLIFLGEWGWMNSSSEYVFGWCRTFTEYIDPKPEHSLVVGSVVAAKSLPVTSSFPTHLPFMLWSIAFSCLPQYVNSLFYFLASHSRPGEKVSYCLCWESPIAHFHWGKLIRPSLTSWRCPWCNSYSRRKWTRRYEFKSWARLIAFHIALIPLGKVWIQLFSLQLWVNSRAD